MKNAAQQTKTNIKRLNLTGLQNGELDKKSWCILKIIINFGRLNQAQQI